jgi:hypothetical protein
LSCIGISTNETLQIQHTTSWRWLIADAAVEVEDEVTVAEVAEIEVASEETVVEAASEEVVAEVEETRQPGSGGKLFLDHPMSEAHTDKLIAMAHFLSLMRLRQG